MKSEVLAKSTILWSALFLITMTVGSGLALYWFLKGPGAPPQLTLDIIRTASSVGLGTGGGVALLLTARKQRSTELSAEFAEHDARERRVTELQAKAGEQLGNANPSVRLNGLYSLERLGEGNPELRQTIVNLVCAYLRMPFKPPAPLDLSPRGRLPGRRLSNRTLPGVDSPVEKVESRSELQVRKAAQDILVKHLEFDADEEGLTNPDFWDGMDINLQGATLVDFQLDNARIGRASFIDARFYGLTAGFGGTIFRKSALFTRAKFGLSGYRSVEAATAIFGDAVFEGSAYFANADFNGGALFGGVKFKKECVFRGASMFGGFFGEAVFHGDCDFSGVQFGQRMQGRRNGGRTSIVFFDGSEFRGGVKFAGAELGDISKFANVSVLEVEGLPVREWPPNFCSGEELDKELPEGVEGQWRRLAYSVSVPEELEGLPESMVRMGLGDPTVNYDLVREDAEKLRSHIQAEIGGLQVESEEST